MADVPSESRCLTATHSRCCFLRPFVTIASIAQRTPMGLGNSQPKLYPGDILEFPGNNYFSHFGVYYGERDGVPYLDPLDVVGKKYRVKNYLDEKHPPRDFYVLIKPEIDEIMTKPVTFDILFNNSEHQATMFRYGVKKSEQIEKVYSKIVPTWKDLFEKKKI
ncbi:Phospholipase A and acyltransferase 1 [Labeo rohita]|uniref:Phospholipase A and acyltransferase 1 n=1 Tax=Labeo rohita TaxID=84645 RepID=A0ABQ8LVT4_LABRO|nr:Phospholipase A and acyltransferase 1 [Labeo rohita]